MTEDVSHMNSNLVKNPALFTEQMVFQGIKVVLANHVISGSMTKTKNTIFMLIYSGKNLENVDIKLANQSVKVKNLTNKLLRAADKNVTTLTGNLKIIALHFNSWME